MKWLWAYIRRKVMESILAGVHDALASKGNGADLTEEEAARALDALVGNSEGPNQLNDDTPPPLLESNGNGSPVQPEQPRRGPGRPRKFQEPPA